MPLALTITKFQFLPLAPAKLITRKLMVDLYLIRVIHVQCPYKRLKYTERFGVLQSEPSDKSRESLLSRSFRCSELLSLTVYMHGCAPSGRTTPRINKS